MKNYTRLGMVGLLMVGLAGGAYLWWQGQQTAAPAAEAPSAVVVSMPQPVASAPAEVPRILHPITPELAAGDAPAKPPGLDSADTQTQQALMGLLERKAVLTFFNLDDLVHRCVATVDGLARGHATSRLWPVLPTPQKFLVTENSQGTFMDERNAERYKPFVKFAVAIDPAAASAVYRRLYPLFQKKYEELGYPRQYFNDRLVAVIDQLLDAPLPTQPVRLALPKIQSPYAISSPWLRYEFTDADLESLPAGQKILIRMGHANATQLQTWLVAFRTHIATQRVDK